LQMDTGYRRNGLLVQIASEKDRAFWEDWQRTTGEFSGATEFLSAQACRSRVITKEVWTNGAIWAPTDGCAEPSLVAPAFAMGAQRLGAHIIAPCAARGFELSGGHISGVVTEAGVIRTRQVVCAGGAWAAALFHNNGLHLPIGDIFSWCASFY